MATRAELHQALRNADAAGDVESARKLAAYIKSLPPDEPNKAANQLDADRKRYDPSAGGGTLQFGPLDTGIKTPEWLDRTLSGVGSGMTSVVRALGGGGVAGAMGLPSTKEEAEKNDAPLLDTVAGQVGQVVGVAAPASLAIPFTPATLGGAATAGAVTGAALTEGDVSERATGAALGGAGAAVAGAAPAVYRASKGLLRGAVEPLSAKGRERIAGRAIERFSTNPSALVNLTSDPTITGARLTLAEATQDPGLMTLQRALGTMDPEGAAALAARQEANNAARLESLRVLAGGAQAPTTGVKRLNQLAYGQPTQDAAIAARSAAANRSYGQAFEAGIDEPMADAIRPQIDSLMSRPSIQAAMADAKRLAAEEGLTLTDPGSVQGLHYLKKALDGTANRAKVSGDADWARLVSQTSDDLASTLEDIAPAYQAARREFQYNSVPVNRAAVGERLLDRTTGAIRDFSGNRKLQANAFAKALNDEEQLIAQSTGFKGNKANLDDILTATQSGRVNAVRNELETLANLNNAANGPGSQTAKMLASQNMLKQIAGPLGVPDSWIESVLSQTALRPIQFAYKASEPRIGAAISEGMLDPARAAELMRSAQMYDAYAQPNALQQLLRRSAPALIGANAAQ